MSNNFPGIGYTTFGRDWNYFQKVTVSATTFGGSSVDGYQPDLMITFNTDTVIFLNENAASAGKIIEYSFNGTTIHGELDAATGSLTKMLTFQHRIISKIWFRIKSGSTGPIVVSVQAWGIQ